MIRLLEIIATITSLISAYMTSQNIFPYNLWGSIISGIFWILWAIMSRNFGIAVVNVGFMLIFISGLIKHYLGHHLNQIYEITKFFW
jgi:hypothetical protein